jgi:two-component system chemotaxis response regulator CheY
MASILIVDDDNFLHKVLERIIVIGGHKVAGHAFDGAEALEKYVQMNPKPDLVLMDHRMPVMNGTTATRELLNIDKNVKILFISADETVKEEAMAAGALDFLTKPIRSADLFTAIEKYSPLK